MIRWIVLVLALTLAGCAASRGPAPAEPERIVVTITPRGQAEMAALAERLETRHGLRLAAEWPLESLGIHCLVFEAADADAALAALEDETEIRSAQRDALFTTDVATYEDPLAVHQSGLVALGAPQIHPMSTGAGVRVAIIDTRVDAAHPDLVGRLVETADFVPDVGRAGGEPHGTAMAGVIGARADRTGIVGVAPDSALMGLRACWTTPAGGRCRSLPLARALDRAILQRVDIVNLSLSGPPDPLLADLVARAVASGIVVVAADGRPDGRPFPAALPGVIAVRPAISRAPPGTVPAPGDQILSTAPNQGYRVVSGSSVAAAHVSGLVALMRQSAPGLSPRDVASILADASSGGRLNGCTAVAQTGEPLICE